MDKKDVVLGAVESPANTGRHLPDYRELSRPMKRPTKVAKVFCVGCGRIIEILPAGAEKLAKKAGLSALPDMTAKYFEVEDCFICGSDFTAVAIRKIEES